jgi:hypothetical protein
MESVTRYLIFITVLVIFIFTCSLFNDIVSSSDYIESNGMINSEGYGRKRSWPK